MDDKSANLADLTATLNETVNSESNAGDSGEEKKLSEADILLELLTDLNLFQGENNEPYAEVEINGNKELMNVNGKQFKRYVCRRFFDRYKSAPKGNAIKSALLVLESKAVFDGDKCQLSNRVANYGGFNWYDLADDKRRSVRINADGWEIADKTPTIFKKFSHQKSQVLPQKNGDIRKILDFVNIKEDDQLLFLIYLVSCFIPGFPHPIQIIHGEKGGSKTMTFKLLKSLIDPSVIQVLTFPKNIQELIQNLDHHWYLGFDNISNITDSTSDALCRAVTGEGFSKRRLYTTDEDKIYSYQRCIALNGINVVATKEDLLDRSLLFQLERISPENRRSEAEIYWKFEEEKPIILGAIFDTVSKAMAIYPTAKPDKLFRLADFTHWGYAIAKALGESGEEFLRQFSSNIERQNREALEGNSIATAIIHLMEDNPEWRGKAADLLGFLETIATNERIDIRSANFPKSANQLTRKLNNIKSNLEEAGIEFEVKHTNKGNILTINKKQE
jgi:hypothetical protein